MSNARAVRAIVPGRCKPNANLPKSAKKDIAWVTPIRFAGHQLDIPPASNHRAQVGGGIEARRIAASLEFAFALGDCAAIKHIGRVSKAGN